MDDDPEPDTPDARERHRMQALAHAARLAEQRERTDDTQRPPDGPAA